MRELVTSILQQNK